MRDRDGRNFLNPPPKAVTCKSTTWEKSVKFILEIST